MRTNWIQLRNGLAVLALSAVSLAGQTTRTYDDHEVVPAPREQIRDFNRASRVIGLPVKNRQNEALGRVEDVVFDLANGRIDHVVLALPTVDGEKYVAVPPGTFTSSAELGGQQLIANLDRYQLERLPTVARGTRLQSNEPLADWDRPTTGRPAPYYSELSRSTARSYSETERRSEHDTFRGRVVAVDPEERTLSVESDRGEVHHFVIADRPNITLKNSRYPRIVDIKVGFPVVVGYRPSERGRDIAQTIIRTDTPEVR